MKSLPGSDSPAAGHGNLRGLDACNGGKYAAILGEPKNAVKSAFHSSNHFFTS
jgi:hypothetical protein